MSMPGGVASGTRGSLGAGAPGSDRRGSARSFGRPRAAARTRRALGVCALAASIPAFAAGAVPVGVALIVGAQVAFAAALLG